MTEIRLNEICQTLGVRYYGITCTDFLDLYLQKVTKLQRFDKLLEDVKPVSGTAGNLVFEMEVKPHHTNNFGILHGGMSAYLIDTLTTVSQVTLGIPPGTVGCFS